MFADVLPVLYPIFLWWFSTGLILVVVSLPAATYGRSLAAASVAGVVALALFTVAATDPTILGAYLGFTAAVVLWGWHETAFLTGHLTGPRRSPQTAGANRRRRFSEAFGTIAYHEVAILLTAALLVAISWDAPNRVGLWTFLVLWVMRISAKLNVFWGVPNINEEFLPTRLGFLRSYFRRGPTNAFFPFAVTAATIVAGALLVHAIVLQPTPTNEVALLLVGTLLALAVLEHWFMVLPLRDAALWRWALRRARAVTAREPQSWRADLVGAYDTDDLRRLLDGVAGGAFGAVDEVRGIARAPSGWVRFGVSGGRPRLAPCKLVVPEPGNVTALGRGLDALGLEAAFRACLARGSPSAVAELTSPSHP